MNKSQVIKINISSNIHKEVQIISDELGMTKSKFIHKAIDMYLKHYKEVDAEVIKNNIDRTRLIFSISVRVSTNKKNKIFNISKSLNITVTSFCRLAITDALSNYKNFGKEFFVTTDEVFSVLKELHELKEYKKLTEKRIEILYNTIQEAGVTIPSDLFKFN